MGRCSTDVLDTGMSTERSPDGADADTAAERSVRGCNESRFIDDLHYASFTFYFSVILVAL